MKKIISLFTVILFGTLAFAEPPVGEIPPIYSKATPQSQEDKPQEENKDIEVDVQVKEIPAPKIIKLQNPDFAVEEKGSQKFYYDKQGNFIARENKVNNQIFFYNKNGQMLGKSIKRNSNTYYYNGLNKFIGYCTEQECFGEDFKSTGTVPPLPAIKEFKPVIDNNILNPQNQTKSSEEE